MTKHTPLMRLQTAKRCLDAAREACPHWDYEQDSSCDGPCCVDVRLAARGVRLARKEMEKTQ